MSEWLELQMNTMLKTLGNEVATEMNKVENKDKRVSSICTAWRKTWTRALLVHSAGLLNSKIIVVLHEQLFYHACFIYKYERDTLDTPFDLQEEKHARRLFSLWIECQWGKKHQFVVKNIVKEFSKLLAKQMMYKYIQWGVSTGAIIATAATVQQMTLDPATALLANGITWLFIRFLLSITTEYAQRLWDGNKTTCSFIQHKEEEKKRQKWIHAHVQRSGPLDMDDGGVTS